MYEFTDTMGEISGFGGSYEAACRAMLKAGLDFLDVNPDCTPEVKEFKNVYGVLADENADAERLTKAMMDATIEDDGKTIRCGDGATSAMHQAVITSILWIRKNGWDAYVENMSKNE